MELDEYQQAELEETLAQRRMMEQQMFEKVLERETLRRLGKVRG
jgi:DNA-binding TFAR19-related protein (PDSD5 family)